MNRKPAAPRTLAQLRQHPAKIHRAAARQEAR